MHRRCYLCSFYFFTNMRRIGRPPKTHEARREQVTVCLNSEEKDSLYGYAMRYDKPVAEVIRESLELLSVIPGKAAKA